MTSTGYIQPRPQENIVCTTNSIGIFEKEKNCLFNVNEIMFLHVVLTLRCLSMYMNHRVNFFQSIFFILYTFIQCTVSPDQVGF